MNVVQAHSFYRVSVHLRVKGCPDRHRDIIQSFLCETLDEAIQTANAWKSAFPSAYVFYSEECSEMIEFL